MPAATAGGFTAARTAFTRFSKSGSSSALGTALAAYVGGGGGSGGGARSGGGGGARRAAQRMGSSRTSGAKLLGVVRDFQAIGAVDALRQLDLEGMANQPASEVFLAMLDFLCPPGGAIDEAISRQAMLEAIGNLDRDAPTAFAQLAPEQLREFFLDFVALSIEGRVIADIGARGITLSADIPTVERAHEQLHDFIEGCCRVHLSGLLTGLEALSNRDVEQRSNEIYEAAFSLIADAGEDAQ
ncbi:MAG: Qat anti-phage system associated protein QatB [Rubrivivax sp.]